MSDCKKHFNRFRCNAPFFAMPSRKKRNAERNEKKSQIVYGFIKMIAAAATAQEGEKENPYDIWIESHKLGTQTQANRTEPNRTE